MIIVLMDLLAVTALVLVIYGIRKKDWHIIQTGQMLAAAMLVVWMIIHYQ